MAFNRLYYLNPVTSPDSKYTLFTFFLRLYSKTIRYIFNTSTDCYGYMIYLSNISWKFDSWFNMLSENDYPFFG